MTPQELLRAAEAKLRDAENNIATCVAALNAHKARQGGVSNQEVIALADVQAALAHAYATVALAGAGVALTEPQPTTEPVKAGGAE
jgi:hypothetical protein